MKFPEIRTHAYLAIEREGNGGEGKYFDTKKPKVYDSDPANIRKIY